ncbi:MAG TPA: GNAT family N-acetyltransferase [Pyrinomonadaceae bacterium]
MRDTRALIDRVTAADAPHAERREAFGELVSRFQDMAYGCAYAVLADSYLAEDAAQEAFITAWQKLGQLREPAAFPGWLRRIVLTQCNRMTRGKRLVFLPLEAGALVSAAEPGPQDAAESRELRAKVLAALRSLPEGERITTTLFYVGEYTQEDICAFLEVPLATVRKRLFTARRRLRRSMVESFKDGLRDERPSRDDSFAEMVGARLRPFAQTDWELLSALAHTQPGAEAQASDTWLAERRRFDESRRVRRHYVAEHAGTGRPLGYGAVEQSVYGPRYRLHLAADPRHLRGGVGRLLVERLTADLREVNAVTVSLRGDASRPELLALLEGHGFVETSRVLDLRLKVSDAQDLAPLLPVAEELARRRVRITTLAEERKRDPDHLEKLYELRCAAELDDPARSPLRPPAFDREEAALWLRLPYVLPDAYFIAVHGDQYVGVCDLNLRETAPGGVTHGFTGVRREWRRQRVATALKARAVEYARSHGYRTVRAFNSPAHGAVLALNEKIGFRPRLSLVTLEKCLREVKKVEPALYDAYAGRYRGGDDGPRPDFVLTIAKEGERLTAEFVGQKVELFPESEASFFIKHFYGEVVFARGDDGRVTHLLWRERGANNTAREMRAAKID